MQPLRSDEPATGRPSAARDERGVVTIEFALILPLILFFVLAIIDFGRFFNYMNDANQIAGNGARFAAVNTNPGGGTLQAYLAAQGDTRELRDGGSRAVANPLSVCISFPNGDAGVGDPVEVEVTSDFELMPLVGGFSIPVKGKATMRIERAATEYSAGC